MATQVFDFVWFRLPLSLLFTAGLLVGCGVDGYHDSPVSPTTGSSSTSGTTGGNTNGSSGNGGGNGGGNGNGGGGGAVNPCPSEVLSVGATSVLVGNQIFAFATLSDCQVYSTSITLGSSTWTPWVLTTAGLVLSSPSVTSYQGSQGPLIALFVIGADGYLKENLLRVGDAWSGYQPVENALTLASPPTSGIIGDRLVAYFTAAGDGQVYGLDSALTDSISVFNPPSLVTGGQIEGEPSFFNFGSTVLLAVTGLDNQVHLTQYSPSGWSPYDTIGGTVLGSPNLSSVGLTVTGIDSMVYVIPFNPSTGELEGGYSVPYVPGANAILESSCWVATPFGNILLSIGLDHQLYWSQSENSQMSPYRLTTPGSTL